MQSVARRSLFTPGRETSRPVGLWWVRPRGVARATEARGPLWHLTPRHHSRASGRGPRRSDLRLQSPRLAAFWRTATGEQRVDFRTSSPYRWLPSPPEAPSHPRLLPLLLASPSIPRPWLHPSGPCLHLHGLVLPLHRSVGLLRMQQRLGTTREIIQEKVLLSRSRESNIHSFPTSGNVHVFWDTFQGATTQPTAMGMVWKQKKDGPAEESPMEFVGLFKKKKKGSAKTLRILCQLLPYSSVS